MNINCKKGFFLLELTITMIIMSVLLFSLSMAISTNLKALKKINNLKAIRYITENKVLQLLVKAKTDEDIKNSSGFETINGINYKWDINFIPENEEKTLYTMEITIYEDNSEIYYGKIIFSK